MKRRLFLKNTAVIGGSALCTPMLYSFSPKQQKIRVAAIGINGMGWSNLNSILKHPDVICTALCDIDANVLKKRETELAQRGITVKTFENYKDVLASKDVDAVIIGTPDHWHALQMIDACKAGKHVYIEKPLGNSIEECMAMVTAAKKHNNIVQVGQWQRSQKHFADAIAMVHSGRLGKIRIVKAWSYVGWKHGIPPVSNTAAPVGVNYDLWLGPAKKRPFNSNRFHFEFRWFWDYAGGLMTDWGVHMLDYALLGMQVSEPKSIVSTGGKFAYPTDASETPDTLNTVYEFDNFNIIWEHTKGIVLGPYERDHGVAFIGENGTLALNRKGWEVIPEKDKMERIPLQKPEDNGLDMHTANFVEAIKRSDPNLISAPVEAGAHIAIFSQMGNIAYRVGKKLHWDVEKKCFDDPEANALIKTNYHNGYQLG